jgi:site-specific recombinase XerD
VVFLSSKSVKWLEKYLASREDNDPALFIRLSGGGSSLRLTARSVQRLIRQYAQKAKLPVEVTPHVLRHSFATDLLMAGADIRSVQEMLGHKNIATTQIYTHVTNQQLRDVHAAFHGRSTRE